MTKLYKIQNKDGLFSTGGTVPDFSRNGKTWNSLSNVKAHLTQGMNVCETYNSCKIVEIEQVLHEVEDNLLQKMFERYAVEISLRSPSQRFVSMEKVLKNFVKTGECFSTELQLYITDRMSAMVEYYVPDYMIENFDKIHNKGLNGCTQTELAAIMLSASKEHQEMYTV